MFRRFGSLAEVCADNPGAFLGTAEAQGEGAPEPADLAIVERALAELGYVSVPEELLESDCEGPSALAHCAAHLVDAVLRHSLVIGSSERLPPPIPARRLGRRTGEVIVIRQRIRWSVAVTEGLPSR